MLRAAHMARSTYFYHEKQSKSEDKYADLKQQIQAIYHSHKGRYGYRRITLALRNIGTVVKGPRIAPDSKKIPLYVEAGINKLVDINAYIGQPLFNEDGSIFGTLCAIDPSVQPQSIEQHSDLLELFSLLLSRILQNELKINEQKRVSEKLEMDSLTDHLTGVFNRRAWDTFLDLEEDRCKTYGHPTTVIMIDLNDLKAINDKFGHSAGDQMIQKTAQILKKNVRSNDLVARLGGDEFGILNIETTLENTQKLVNRLLKSLQNAGINAALGVAAREPSKNLRMAVIEADEKMYQHKRQIKVII